jgi:hypothetical protein
MLLLSKAENERLRAEIAELRRWSEHRGEMLHKADADLAKYRAAVEAVLAVPEDPSGYFDYDVAFNDGLGAAIDAIDKALGEQK